MGRNKQLDKGADGQAWKCHDPLNCISLVESRANWLQIWHMGANMDWHFRRTCMSQPPPAWLRPQAWSLGAVITQVRMVSTSISLICCASLKWKREMQGRCRYIYWPTWKNNREARIYCDYAGRPQCLVRRVLPWKLDLLILWTDYMLSV